MMNGFILAILTLATFPALTHANDLRVSSYEMSDTGGIVLLESDSAIGEPWMRIDGRSVRIWFPQVGYVARFDHARDAQDPIRGLNLRPGADDSAVLRLDLGAGRKLTREDIEVTRNGQNARVQVRFERPERPEAAVTRPILQPSAAAPATPRVAPPVAATSGSTTTPQIPGAAVTPATPSAQAAPAPAQDAAPSSNSARAAAGSPASTAVGGSAIRTLAQKADGNAPSQLGLASGSGANIGGLLLLSGVLCAVYLGIRAYGKKRAVRSPDIQVISARRLGHRSEMLVVRALGADHLLVTSAGRVERVASVPTPVEPEPLPEPPLAAPAAPNAAVEAEAVSQANGLGIISKLSSSYRVRKLLDAVEAEPPPPDGEELPAGRDPRKPAFGPELLSAMNAHKLANLGSIPQLANKQSEAVAGIARLRAGGRGAN